MLLNSFNKVTNEFEEPKLHAEARIEFDLFPVLNPSEVTTDNNHYTIEQIHSNKYIVFDTDNDVIVHVVDNLALGTGYLFANVGSGGIQVVMDGTEQLRGLYALADGDSFITLVKIHERYWQCSERV